MFNYANKYWMFFILIMLLTTGCAAFPDSFKQTISGPTGEISDIKPRSIYHEHPPREFYDLEKSSGMIFQFIQTEKWPDAEAEFQQLKTTWLTLSKSLVDNNTLTASPESKISALSNSIQERKVTQSLENINQFMGSISDISKTYKISPVTDIIMLGNSLRNISAYASIKDWSNLEKKTKELENMWHDAKPGVEQVGIISESTKIHASINRLKDAIDSENIAQVTEEIHKINESLAKIRIFYYGK